MSIESTNIIKNLWTCDPKYPKGVKPVKYKYSLMILIGTPEELQKVVEYLKEKFDIKNFEKTKFCLDLQIEYLEGGIFVHQIIYTQKVLKRFYMDKTYTLSTPTVARSLDPNKDPFRSWEEDEEIFGPEIPYLSVIGTLMYLTNYTKLDISFAVIY